jgi:Rha family phage regulatory protein
MAKDLVQIVNNQIVVSSRQVAEHFEKEHRNVLASIKEILAAENSATKFFQESAFENRGKSYPEYLMNRDGFSLLVMGFTGKEALTWKLKYIQAFNEMEQKLKGTQAQPADQIKAFRAQAMLNNSVTRKAKAVMQLSETIALSEYKEVLKGHAAELLTGQRLLPKGGRKTCSAAEIGEKLGVSANMVGRLTNAHNLKTPEYGQLFFDKSPNSNKEVETFRYYENIVPALREILSKDMVQA